MTWLGIIFFGAIGVGLRAFIGLALPIWHSGYWATLSVNILGSFMMGVLIFSGHIPESFRIPLTVGLLGGFTTFSSFSVELFRMIQHSQWVELVLYGVFSPLMGVLAVALGALVSR